jgi:hypothetical protein
MAAVNHMVQANEQFASERITPAQHAALHEAAMVRALKELAAQCGIELVMPLQINSIGEISIVAKPGPQQSAKSLGHFGQEFADYLNSFSPRTNLRPGVPLSADNGRCHMNHLDVEKMLLAHSARLSGTAR